MEKELDSNNLNSTINNVCSDCGIEANRLTCLKKYGNEPIKAAFDVSTFHKGICDFCKKEKSITEVRDFFYPDFNLLKKKDASNWRKEFDEMFHDKNEFCDCDGSGCEDCPDKFKKYIESLLIKILAECESAKDARMCRHIIKEYILKK